MQSSIPGHFLASKREPVGALADAFDLLRSLASTSRLLQICLRAPEEKLALPRVEQFNQSANALLYTFTLACDVLKAGDLRDPLAARYTSPVRFGNVSSTSYASLTKDVALAQVEVVEDYWREIHGGKIVHVTLNPQYAFDGTQVAEIRKRFEALRTFAYSGTADEQLEAIRASFGELIVGLRQEEARATASGITLAGDAKTGSLLTDYPTTQERQPSTAQPAQKRESDMPTHPFNWNRLRELKELLDIQYEKLRELEKELELAAGADQEVAIRQKIKQQIVPNVPDEHEYAKLLAAGVPDEAVPEQEAESIIAELVEATTRTAESGQASEKMLRLLGEIKEKLNEPGRAAGARLKTSLPIVPLLISYELELNTENFIAKVWRKARDVFTRLVPGPSVGPSQDDFPAPIVTGLVKPALQRDLERSIANGELQHSLLAPIVLETLREATELELASPYNPFWITTGIRLSDEYLLRVRQSAGHRDWQRDFAQTAAPTLIGVARSRERSAEGQAVIVRLCHLVAGRLRLKLIWPEDPDELNDLKNSIYRACLDAGSLECDYVLAELKAVTVVGPE